MQGAKRPELEQLRQLHGGDLAEIKAHLPLLVKKMAAKKPGAIIFMDTSARPYFWVIDRLWSGMGLGEKPKIRFLSPPPNFFSEKESSYYQRKLARWINENKLGNSQVILFDDLVYVGNTLKRLKFHLQKAGVRVTTAVMSGNRFEPSQDHLVGTQIQGVSPFYFSLRERLRKPPSKLHVSLYAPSPSASELKLRKACAQLAEEILEERLAAQRKRPSH